MIDLHTHILSGIDDGASDMEESLEMCRIAAEDGTTAMIASPHMFNGMFEVSREQIIDGVERLRKRLKAEGINLLVAPGADVRAVADLPELLRAGKAMTVANRGRHIMVELPRDVLPQGLDRLFFSIQLLGIVPIISHPERNEEVLADPRALARFVEAGALVQLTAGSVAGDFGSAIQECAHILLAEGLAHLIASDAHSSSRRPPGLSRAFVVTSQVLPNEEVEQVFLHRALAIFLGEQVNPPKPAKRTRRRRKIFRFGSRVKKFNRGRSVKTSRLRS